MKTVKGLLLLCLVVVMIFSMASVMAIIPSGANIVAGANQTAPADTPSSHPAVAGNVTELTISGFARTQSWQGYFGNVSGTIQLADANDKVMYNWSLASPEGEVYATKNSSVEWANIACFNLVTNHLVLESAFGIATDDVDGVNETFENITNVHDEFYTNNVQFTAGKCPSTEIYDNTGTGVDNHFEEVLLTDASGPTQVIFTSILDEESPLGFDAASHDFEMLVLENGHGTDVTTTTYYFYVELE